MTICDKCGGTGKIEKDSSVTTSVRTKRKTEISDEFRERMAGKYFPAHKVTEVYQEIDAAMGHKSYNKWDDKQLYVQRWLKRAFDSAPAAAKNRPADAAEYTYEKVMGVEKKVVHSNEGHSSNGS